MKKIVVLAAIASLLAGCGGGGGHSSTIPSAGNNSSSTTPVSSNGSFVPVSSPAGTARATATATVGASALLPQFGARVAPHTKTPQSITKRRSLASYRATQSIAQVIVNGTLYQSTASVTQVTNSQTIVPSNNGVTVSMTFSNVVPANNDWIVFDFIAQASDGSEYDLGDLATMIDISSNGTNTVSLDANSTLRFQSIVSSLGAALSSYDLENNSGLDGAIATYLANHPQYQPDPNTGLFSPATQQLIANDLLNTYGRTVTINTTGGTGTSALFSITYDYTATDENDLAVNACPFDDASGCTGTSNNNLYHYTGFAGAGITYPNTIYGIPGGACYDLSYIDPTYEGQINDTNLCGQGPSIPVHTPSVAASTAYANVVVAAMIESGGSTSITLPVYGGHIIIGAHDRSVKNNLVTLPASGGTLSIAGEPPGSFSATIPMSSTSITVNATDPQTQAMDESGDYWSSGALFGGSDASGTTGNVYLNGGSLYNTTAQLGGTYTTPPNGYTAFPTSNSLPGSVPIAYVTAYNISSTATGSLSFSVPQIYSGYTYSLGTELYGATTWTPGLAGPVSAYYNGSADVITFPSVSIPTGTNELLALYVTINNTNTPITPVFGYVLQPNFVTSGGGASFYTYCPGPTNSAGACYFAQYASPPTTTTYSFSPPNSVPGLVPNFNNATVSLTLDTWNPFGIPNSELDMCTVGSCTPLVGSGTINATSTFYDNGTNLSYYNWHGSGGGSDATTSVTSGPSYYTVNWNAANGLTGTFSSTTPALFGPQEFVYADTSVPNGTQWQLAITDSNANTYTGVKTTQNGAEGNNAAFPVFFFPSIVTAVTTSNITFTYTLPSGTTGTGSFQIYYL